MKQLFALILLCMVAIPGYGDATLTFKTYSKSNNSKLLTYYIKDGVLRYNEEDSNRINLYNRSKQVFMSMNQKDRTISRIDPDIIEQRSKMINQKRLDKLSEVEAGLNEKLKTMSPDDQEVAASLMNKLKYPEFYGAHTFLKVTASKENRTVNGYPCRVYQLRREDTLIKTICVASAEALGLSADDYQTLRDFFHFNYQAQSKMMIAAGKTDFTFIDYRKEKIPGVAVEITEYADKPAEHPSLQIQQVSTKTLEPSLFEIQIPEK